MVHGTPAVFISSSMSGSSLAYIFGVLLESVAVGDKPFMWLINLLLQGNL
jgi:hypothetical protein